MANETEIYLTGLVFPGAQPLATPYDPTQPQKSWALPSSAWPAGAAATDTFTAFGLNPYNLAHEAISGTYDWASKPNIAGVSPSSGLTTPVEINQNVVPIPVDLSKIPAGYELAVDALAVFGQLPDLIPIPTPTVGSGSTAQSTEDPNIIRLVNGENEILVRLGLATV